MSSFLFEMSHEFLLSASQGNPWKSYCEWKNDYGSFQIRCMSNRIVEIHCDRLDVPNFNLYYLPSTVIELRIYSCFQSYDIDTRRFPREAMRIELGFNRIHGTLNLRTLPSKLSVFDVSSNQITGPIDLTGLPPSLTSLELSYNRINQKCVYYGNLPAILDYIGLQPHLIDAGIGELRPLEASMSQKRVFNVHQNVKVY